MTVHFKMRGPDATTWTAEHDGEPTGAWLREQVAKHNEGITTDDILPIVDEDTGKGVILLQDICIGWFKEERGTNEND